MARECSVMAVGTGANSAPVGLDERPHPDDESSTAGDPQHS